MDTRGWGVQFAELTFDRLLGEGKVSEDQRTTFYLGVAAGLGVASERLSRRFPASLKLEKVDG